jgi:DNA-directed RNA polymerase specialized sigma24 family protein
MPASPISGERDLDASETLQDSDARVKQAEATLAPGEPRSEHDAARRLHGDQLVVEAILDQGLHGPRHRELEEALIRYAVPVLLQQLAEGQIVSKATQLGRPPGDPEAWLYFTKADREEFAYDMVADALPVFTRKVFEEKRWSPDGGASLKTYFVNACTLQFSGLFRKWQDQRRTVRPVGLEVRPGNGSHAPSPALTVELRDEAASMLGKITDRQIQEVLVLRAAGYTAEDAARRAGLTVKAAESRLGRIRKGLKAGRDSNDDVVVVDDPASAAVEGKCQNRPDEADVAAAYRRPGQDQRPEEGKPGACKEES